uniref:Uncharacterized protein n=1 Tax=Plectus sambesii TaxID=2011161 RepID=A0A914XQM0_9BILA
MALAGADNPGYANHLPKICNAITYYDKCFLTESDRFCGEKGWNFLLRLNEVTSKALYEMLRYAAVIDQIPVACELWHSPQNYAAKHRQRLLGVRAVSNSSSAKPSALLPSTILCILMLLSSSFLLSLLFRSC